MHKTLDVVTLFHKPSIQASVRIATILQQASAQSQAPANEDQAADHTPGHIRRDPFELEITESPPTKDQLKSIFDYAGGSKAAQLVKGASSSSDALRKVREDPENFIRPVVVDWNRGKAGKVIPRAHQDVPDKENSYWK